MIRIANPTTGVVVIPRLLRAVILACRREPTAELFAGVAIAGESLTSNLPDRFVIPWTKPETA